MPAISTEDLIDGHLKSFGVPSILNIDIEGIDELVVMEIDFCRAPIPVVLVEKFVQNSNQKMREIINSDLHKYMQKFGYSLQSVCGPTLVFLRPREVNLRDDRRRSSPVE